MWTEIKSYRDVSHQQLVSVMEYHRSAPISYFNLPLFLYYFPPSSEFQCFAYISGLTAQKQSFFVIYATLFHAYISYLIMWCDCYMSQSLISHHVTGYALFHLFFHHCITFWWLAQPVTAFWWLTQPVITFWWLVQPVLVLNCLTDVCIYTCWCNSFIKTITYTSLNAS